MVWAIKTPLNTTNGCRDLPTLQAANLLAGHWPIIVSAGATGLIMGLVAATLVSMAAVSDGRPVEAVLFVTLPLFFALVGGLGFSGYTIIGEVSWVALARRWVMQGTAMFTLPFAICAFNLSRDDGGFQHNQVGERVCSTLIPAVTTTTAEDGCMWQRLDGANAAGVIGLALWGVGLVVLAGLVLVQHWLLVGQVFAGVSFAATAVLLLK